MADTLPWWATFASAGFAACTAEVATLPIDTTKVRLQLLQKARDTIPTAAAASSSSSLPPSPPSNLGMLGMMKYVAKEEGTAALYKGFWPAIQRQLVFASLRIGVYKQISEYFKKPGESTISLGRKIVSGLLSGAIGILVANPTDLVKVRMQSEGRLLPGQSPRYKGVMDAYRTIIRQEGVAGLWTGLGPAVLRNSIINATELASYETAKEFLVYKLGVPDNLIAHFSAGAAAGLMATIIGNPVDVIKTRVMAARKAAEAVPVTKIVANGTAVPPSSSEPYKGAIDCVVQTFRNEGIMAFYQGVVPQFFRLTGWSIVMFVTFEQVKAFAVRTVGVPTKVEAKE